MEACECGGEIFIKKRKLCRKCYQKLTRWKSKFIEHEHYSLDKNHPGLRQSMRKLHNPFVTLQDIGLQYGVTREYIRQLCPSILGETYSDIRRRKMRQLRSEVVAMGCKYDPRQR